MQTVGSFQIIEQIGRGGMAVVYKAWQPSLNRPVALKVLTGSFAEELELVARFRREARIAARLKHPHIVSVFEASLEKPPYFIAMEYLEGGTLRQRLSPQRRLPLHQAYGVVAQMAQALDHAHRQGVVHRDVKPANIMFDGERKAVLTDFGIVRVVHDARLTVDGSRFGTPEYMSPEQAAGLEVGPASDLYSLAVVFYEMICGHPPFVGDPLVVMRKVADSTPPPVSAILEDEAPRGIDSILATALAKRPDERYHSGAEFAEAVRQVLVAPRSGRSPIPVKSPPKPRPSSAPHAADQVPVKPEEPKRTRRYPHTRKAPPAQAPPVQAKAEAKRAIERPHGAGTTGQGRRLGLTLLTVALMLSAVVLAVSQIPQLGGSSQSGGGQGRSGAGTNATRENRAPPATKPQPVTVWVPLVWGKALSVAEKELEQHRLGWEVQGDDESLLEDQLWVVVSQDPPEGSLRDLGTSVTLTVEKRVRAPELSDKLRGEAEAILKARDLRLGEVTYGEPRKTAGLVLEIRVEGKTIKPGTYLRPETPVDLVVSKKKSSPPPPPPPPPPPTPPPP